MASKKFQKGSEEWQMFTDLYVISESIWIPENTDEYRKELWDSLEAFYFKYQNIPCAMHLAEAIITSKDAEAFGKTYLENDLSDYVLARQRQRKQYSIK